MLARCPAPALIGYLDLPTKGYETKGYVHCAEEDRHASLGSYFSAQMAGPPFFKVHSVIQSVFEAVLYKKHPEFIETVKESFNMVQN